MADAIQTEADRRLEAALQERGARDPREFYRVRLRELRDADAGAYDKAVEYYRQRLLPAIAQGGADPLVAWTEYGRTLAELQAPGRTVGIDGSGRSTAYESPMEEGHLVLHLPRDPKMKALLVGLPPELTPAQRATYDWLVLGRQKMKETEE